jgi:hypothetical protein
MSETTAHCVRLDKPASEDEIARVPGAEVWATIDGTTDEIVVWATSPEDAVDCVRRAGLTVA